jgi:alkyl hydroperoxide reductase subunit F
VDILYEHVVTEVNGTRAVEGVTVENLKNGDRRTIDAQGVFVEIGLIPNVEMVRGLLEFNEMGEIVIDNACRTSRPGIFAAGDVTSVPFKQIIIAGGEGAKAALAACDYLLREAKSIV